MQLGQGNGSSGLTLDSAPLPKSKDTLPHAPSLPELVFPPEHALSRLRNLWQGGKAEPTVRLSLTCGEEALPLSSEHLEEEAQALQEAVTQSAGARWEYLWAQLTHGVRPDVDEQVLVCLSQDEMVAWMLLFPPVGEGKKQNMLQLLQSLAACGVSSGVNLSRVKEISAREERYFQLYPVAWGTLPVPGEDGYVIERHPSAQKRCAPIRELGKEDYVSLNLVQDIEKGDIICEIVPPTRGTAGNTVTGTRLPAQEGTAAEVPQGRNTELTEDGRYLVAAQFGHVEFTGRNFQVKPILEVFQSLEHPEDSVNFLGDVHIHGDVCCGVTVRAMGNIQVDGVIEACTIEAGENLVVSSGVQGQDCAVIRAHKSIYAKYLEHCQVYARESVLADCIIDCNVYSDGKVSVRTGRGAVVGGNIRAASEVSATTVGSKAERLTYIGLGGAPCEDFERLQIQREYEVSCKELEREEKKPETPERKNQLSKMRLNLYVTRMKLDKCNKEAKIPMPPQPGEDRRWLICDTAYPGTVVTIDRSVFRVETIRQNCRIGLIGTRVGYV